MLSLRAHLRTEHVAQRAIRLPLSSYRRVVSGQRGFEGANPRSQGVASCFLRLAANDVEIGRDDLLHRFPPDHGLDHARAAVSERAQVPGGAAWGPAAEASRRMLCRAPSFAVALF